MSAPRTISIVPTWSAAVEVYLAALEDGTETGKDAARQEFRRMARLLDQWAEDNQLPDGRGELNQGAPERDD